MARSRCPMRSSGLYVVLPPSLRRGSLAPSPSVSPPSVGRFCSRAWRHANAMAASLYLSGAWQGVNSLVTRWVGLVACWEHRMLLPPSIRLARVVTPIPGVLRCRCAGFVALHVQSAMEAASELIRLRGRPGPVCMMGDFKVDPRLGAARSADAHACSPIMRLTWPQVVTRAPQRACCRTSRLGLGRHVASDDVASGRADVLPSVLDLSSQARPRRIGTSGERITPRFG